MDQEVMYAFIIHTSVWRYEIWRVTLVWVEKESVMLNKISQRKDKYWIISFVCGLYRYRFREYIE